MQVQEDVEQQYARVATKRCECCVPVALVRGLNQRAWLTRDANGHAGRRHEVQVVRTLAFRARRLHQQRAVVALGLGLALELGLAVDLGLGLGLWLGFYFP